LPGFKWLADLMELTFDRIFDFLQGIGIPSYGLAILIITLIIKFLLLPLTLKQNKAMKEMQEIQPLTKEIQQKYKNDPKKMNEEIANLYRTHKINPAMGCLPILIQLPFLIAFFTVLRDYPYIPEYQSFWWIPNLGQMDPYYILPILVGVTMFIQQKLTPTSGDASQQKIMMFMPVFIAWISMKFPAGLSLYWVLGNIFSIVQQVIQNRMNDRKSETLKGESSK
jgi:YidC/Oxa1 family membrane protein insertase